MRRLPALALGALGALAAAELAFRLLPVNAGWGNPPPAPELPLIRYAPGARFAYSRGWRLDGAVAGRFNNYGYVSAHDYAPRAPSAVVLGDSFVEGAMIQAGARLHERLEAALAPRLKAVSLSQSGADLADHVVAARFALAEFETRALVLALNETDFAAAGRPKRRGCWFAPDGAGGLAPRCAAEVRWRNLFYASALLSYLHLNLKFAPADIVAVRPAPAPPAPASALPPPPRRLSPDEARDARHFFAAIAALATRAGLERRRVLVALDADRTRLGAPQAAEPWRETALALAAAEGLTVIDLAPVFRADWAAHGKRPDFGAADAHWNARGHRIVAEALLRHLAALD
jgi:hypothetical protein